MLRGYFKIKYFQRALCGIHIHTHYPKILLNHINIDEYEQREAENTKRSLTRYCLQKTKIKIQQDTHTDNTIRFVMLKMNPADQNNTNKT